MDKPTKPNSMNGDHEALWKFIDHLLDEVKTLRATADRRYQWLLGLLVTSLIGIIIGLVGVFAGVGGGG